MAIEYWWMLLVWAIVAAVLFVRLIMAQRKQKEPSQGRAFVAHLERLIQLPEYRRTAERYRRLLYVIAGVVGAGCLISIFLSLRPVMMNLNSTVENNRDVLLCLDVSGSMVKVDADIAKTYRSLIEKLDGQRLGMVVFNSSASTVFPLTDDREYIIENIDKIIKILERLAELPMGPASVQSLNNEEYELFNETIGPASAGSQRGTSLASDGLASCADAMGSNEAKRPQSIIFATDNDMQGTGIVTMPQAIKMTEKKGVRVYAVDPGGDMLNAGKRNEQLASELKLAASTTGGAYYQSKTVSTDDIASKISEQEAFIHAGDKEIVRSDWSGPWVLLLVGIVVLYAVLLWRFKL